jgi:hypothetical protein
MQAQPSAATRTMAGLNQHGGDGALLERDGPDALYHQLVELGTRWSDRHAKAEFLDECACASPSRCLLRLPMLPRLGRWCERCHYYAPLSALLPTVTHLQTPRLRCRKGAPALRSTCSRHQLGSGSTPLRS